MNPNPYDPPQSLNEPVSTKRAWTEMFARLSIAMTVICLLCMFLSTRWAWVAIDYHKGWIRMWLQGAGWMWGLANLLAIVAVVVRRDRMSKIAIAVAQTPLLLPLLVIVKRLLFGI